MLGVVFRDATESRPLGLGGRRPGGIPHVNKNICKVGVFNRSTPRTVQYIYLGFNPDKTKNKKPLGMCSDMSPHRFVRIPKLSYFSKIRHLKKTPKTIVQ